MTSKNSFLVNLKQNAERRTWSILLFAIVFFFSLPVALMLNISSIIKYTDKEFIPTQMLASVRNIAVSNVFIMVFTFIFAVIAAIHGFSYLYSRKKTDMYLSVPVSIEKRFAAIFLNSIIMYIVPYIIFLVITIIIAGTYGIKDPYIIKMAFVSLGINTLFYIAVYAVTTIAVMLTGNLPVTVLGAGTLLCYENGVKLLLLNMFGSYFKTYSHYSDEMFLKTWVSPIGIFVNYQNDFSKALRDNLNVMPMVQKTALHLIVLIIVYMVIAFLLYKARPIEACSKSMAFKKSKKIIKRLIMIPVALVFGVFFESASGGSLGGAIFGLAAGIVLCHCVIQAIYEMDLKAVFKDKRSIVYIAVVAGFIFALFRFDIIGYDKFVPNENKLVSGTISLNTPFGDRASYYDENYGDVTGDEYRFENMNITDKSLLCDIAYTAAQEIDNYDNVYSGGEDNPNIISATMKYTLSNGKNIYRNIAINYTENTDLINRIFADTSFKENYLQLYDNIFSNNENLFEISYCNEFITEEVQNNNELINAYKKDFLDMTFSDVSNKFVSGYLELTAVMQLDSTGDTNTVPENNMKTIYYDLPVFDTFVNTKAVLAKQGIDINQKANIEDISSVSVYNYKKSEPLEITDKEEIKEILDSVYTMSQSYYSAVEFGYEENYYVEITYEPEKYNGYKGYYTVTCEFKKGQVPDFIEQ